MRFDDLVSRVSRYMGFIAGATLILVMLLTVLDVILRQFNHPITGVYDLVALGGSVVIGFSIPYAADRRIHVFMEMFQQLQVPIVKRILNVTTRLIALVISVLIGWNLVRLGTGFRETGEASLTIQIAYYPIAIGLGICFFVQAVVFIVHAFKMPPGENNE